MEIIRSTEQKTVTWAGGTAIQLAIWPEEARFDDQNFLWRMSAAEVTEERSEFTHIPDYQRFMGIREGALLINHGDHIWYYMNPRFPAVWDGAVPTLCKGHAKNMNLMIRKDRMNGAIQSVLTKATYEGSRLRDFFDIREAVQGTPMDLCPPRREKSPVKTGDIFGLYVSSGDDIELQLTESDGGRRFVLHSGDLALWELGDAWKRAKILSCGCSQLFGVWVMKKEEAD